MNPDGGVVATSGIVFLFSEDPDDDSSSLSPIFLPLATSRRMVAEAPFTGGSETG